MEIAERIENYEPSSRSLRLYERFGAQFYFPPLRKCISDLTDFSYEGAEKELAPFFALMGYAP